MRILAAAAALAVACAFPAGDEVTSLPGWSGPLPSRIFSGFLDGGSDVQDGISYSMQMWYMLILAENVTDPRTAPLVLWSNGGPGASSAYGLFTELGPFTLSSKSLETNPPTLFRNPYAWTGLASVLILNGPAPVGYSYCTPAGPAGNFTSCGSWNDTRTAVHNAAFVASFFKAFPEFAATPFYLTGESYAGVYLTTLTELLLDAKTTPNLRGLALGDACMGTDVLCGPSKTGPWLHLLFIAGQGCVSLSTFNAILEQCPFSLLRDGPITDGSIACQQAVALADVECPSNAYYSYNYLDQCPPDPFDAAPSRGLVGPPAPAEPSGYPCGGDGALKTWITLPATKAALHVAPDAQYESADNGNGFVYNVTFASALPLIRRLQTGVDGVRVLVYNGETDPSVSSVRSQAWTFGLGFPVKEAWRPWTFGAGSSTVAGQVVQWEGNVAHATIRGSGHMVPGMSRKRQSAQPCILGDSYAWCWEGAGSSARE